MKATTIYIIAGVLVVLLLLWFFVFKGKTTTSTVDRSAWDKKVSDTYKWLSTDPEQIAFLTQKANANKISLKEQTMADAEWHAENEGFKRPI